MLTLLKAGIKRQKGTIVGLFILIFTVSVAFVMALTVYINSSNYVRQEMSRLGYGNITAWVSKVDNLNQLTKKIASTPDVKKVKSQTVIFAGYTINGENSDNEGQLIAYEPEQYAYKILDNGLNGYDNLKEIKDGQIYISPALQSKYNVKIGDKVHFKLSRNGTQKIFTVEGYFEDPFMGSSMIDMKSFLISKADLSDVRDTLSQTSNINNLARDGSMLHIFQSNGSKLSTSEFNKSINKVTSLAQYTEFVYSDSSIYGYMLILQNIFTGFLVAFVVILILVSMIVMGHSISNAIEQEYKDMGILKTIGCTSRDLRFVQFLQYVSSIVVGMITGFACSIYVIDVAARTTITSTGMLMPKTLPYGWCIAAFVIILCVFALFIYIKTLKIAQISPLSAINGDIQKRTSYIKRNNITVSKGLLFQLAIRQILSGGKRYLGTGIVAILLVFFVSLVGRMNIWLGPNGEGLMNAFSVADYDLGVKPLNDDVNMKEVENIISSYSKMKKTYEIAEQRVTANGVNYTVNAVNEPSRFHILSGHSSYADNEIVVTEFVADDLGIRIGDKVNVMHGTKSNTYTVAGIYQCANQMGGNIGMSREGYAKIRDVNSHIWCNHYILTDSSKKDAIMNYLQKKYPVDLTVHTNSWSGLEGIVNTMHFLTVFMYVIVVIFILVVIALTSSKMLFSEQRDMAVFKSIGFTSLNLRIAFAIRFGIVVAIGTIIGTALSCILADPIITLLLKSFGINKFESTLGFGRVILIPFIITLLFVAFAYIFSSRIKRVDLTTLINQ
ncbi:ABC transporter permease [Clostridium estertheticum]|uniref:ABC transporter permease n=1 Tax=Clostridium estertheticum TaxID=238834 RepID=UPI001CF0DF5E|nr:ABC transporter permease [Clostridium estertheticum]MCB2354617.1 ABC transporter permease [Clostridium estertheticum]WAG40865.1 ABC transporter permease [Clostridium estertheticum]